MHVFVHRELTAASRTVGEDYERGRPEIDAEHGRVFVGSADHGLYALRAGERHVRSGASRRSASSSASRSTTASSTSSTSARTTARSTRSTPRRARSCGASTTGAEVAKKPVLAGEILLVANASDQLFALDRRSGKQLWRCTARRRSAWRSRATRAPRTTRSSGSSSMAFSDGHVIAYDVSDGAEQWTPVDLSAEAEQSAGGDAPRYLDVDTTPVLDDGANGRVVYVAELRRRRLRARRPDRRARLGEREGDRRDRSRALGRARARADPERAGLAADRSSRRRRSSSRRARSAASGASTRRRDDSSGGSRSPKGASPRRCRSSGAILVGTTRYGLFLISPRNGRVIDGIDLGTGFAQTPAAFGGRAYAMTNQGTFLGVQVERPIRR